MTPSATTTLTAEQLAQALQLLLPALSGLVPACQLAGGSVPALLLLTMPAAASQPAPDPTVAIEQRIAPAAAPVIAHRVTSSALAATDSITAAAAR